MLSGLRRAHVDGTWPNSNSKLARRQDQGQSAASGGRGGSGSSGSSSSSGRGGRSGSSSSSSSARSVPLPKAVAGRTSATAYGEGSRSVQTIPQGQLFAGRTEGGGVREEVFGTRGYGSGYTTTSSSGIPPTTRGVKDHDFPYYYWPVVWVNPYGYPFYLYDTPEYGDPSNSSRPGGSLTQVPFTSAVGNTTLHLIADNSTTAALAEIVGWNCSAFLSSNQTITTVNDSLTNSSQFPEEAIQYYRASTVVLTLDGYNNSAGVQLNATVDVPLPSWVNQSMLECVNETIGAAAPLIDAGHQNLSCGTCNMGIFLFVWVFGYFLSTLL